MTLILASEFFDSFHKTKPIIQHYVEGKKVLFVPTAAIGEGFEPAYERTIKPFEECGATVETLNINDVSEKHLREKLTDTAAIYVCGGNTFYLLEKMRACNFKKVLREALAKDLLYVGSSAGSIVLSPDIDFIRPMDSPEKSNITDTTGLNLINFSFVPHLGHTEMGQHAITIKNNHANTQKTMLVLKDNQALHIENKVITVL